MVRASAIQAPTTAHHNLLPLTKLLGAAEADRSLEIYHNFGLQVRR